ncbi:MAG: hypothetical protein ACE5LC_01265 [Candidatus Aminicenantales bacterium]
MTKKEFLPLFFILFLLAASSAFSFSLKISYGLDSIGGGDFNRSIQGWRSYFADHNQSPYSFDYNLGQLRSFWGWRLELIHNLSSHLSIGLAMEMMSARLSGDMSWDFNQIETYSIGQDETVKIKTAEESYQEPHYRLKAFPLLFAFYYSFPLSRKLKFSLGAGAGFYRGRLQNREYYTYSFDYEYTYTTDCCLLTDVDEYFATGDYEEKSRSLALGFHGGGSLELRLSSSLSFVVEIFARWVNFKGWKGERLDEYTWEHTWGPFGTEYDSGQEKELTGGKLWLVDYECSETGKTYPRLVFSPDMPVSPFFREVREGIISLSGVSARIGFLIRI